MKKSKYYLCGAALIAFVLFSIFFSIAVGVKTVPVREVADIILHQLGWHITPYWPATDSIIVWELRFPRSILALLAGSGLAIAGVGMQAVVKNPLADPYILGISSGASAGATAVIAMDLLDVTATYSVPIGAFAGSLLSIFLLFSLYRDSRDSVRLLLSGCVISIFFSALTSIMMFMSKDQEKVGSVVFWLMGSLADASWRMIPITASVVIVGFIALYFLHRRLNALLLGEETAHTLGVETGKLRTFIVVLVALMVGAIVAFCGMIGFIGFVIPHIVRSFVGADHRQVLPLSAFIGSVFLLWCDVLARVLVVPEELPIGIITAMLGAPFFIYILRFKDLLPGGTK